MISMWYRRGLLAAVLAGGVFLALVLKDVAAEKTGPVTAEQTAQNECAKRALQTYIKDKLALVPKPEDVAKLKFLSVETTIARGGWKNGIACSSPRVSSPTPPLPYSRFNRQPRLTAVSVMRLSKYFATTRPTMINSGAEAAVVGVRMAAPQCSPAEARRIAANIASGPATALNACSKA